MTRQGRKNMVDIVSIGYMLKEVPVNIRETILHMDSNGSYIS